MKDQFTNYNMILFFSGYVGSICITYREDRIMAKQDMEQSGRNIIICDGIVPLCFPDEDLCRILNFWSEKYREMERETIFEGFIMNGCA